MSVMKVYLPRASLARGGGMQGNPFECQFFSARLVRSRKRRLMASHQCLRNHHLVSIQDYRMIDETGY